MNETDTKTKEEYPAWVLDENGEPIIYGQNYHLAGHQPHYHLLLERLKHERYKL